ncbi:MAG TPA: amino acid ABC transporter substrate-binding protein, partial [Burkholderiales bacterium]|nr:amino acid ABC transporter substrate-binding protein [Burkholderiales bacterium]
VAPAVGHGEIVIGVTAVVSGTSARTGQDQLRGLQLWMEETNARGGLLEHKLALKHYDDRGEFEGVAGLYQKLIVEDKTSLLVGPVGVDSTLAAAAVAERNDIPMVALGTVPNDMWARGYKNIVSLYASADVYAHPVLELAKTHGLRRVALLWQNTPFAREIAEGIRLRSKMLGLHAIFDESYDKDSNDFSAIIARLKPKRPDVLLVASTLPDSIAWTRQLKDGKLSAKVMVLIGAALPEYGKALGADADGVMGVSQWEAFGSKTPGVADFVRRFKTKHGYEPGYVAAGGYAAGQVLEAAVKKAGSLEPARVRRALFELDIVTVFGRYKVSAAGKQLGKPIYVVQWVNGERPTVLPEDAAAVKPQYPFRHWGRR